MNAYDIGGSSGIASALMSDFAYGYAGGTNPNLDFSFGGLVREKTYNVFLYSVYAADFTNRFDKPFGEESPRG